MNYRNSEVTAANRIGLSKVGPTCIYSRNVRGAQCQDINTIYFINELNVKNCRAIATNAFWKKRSSHALKDWSIKTTKDGSIPFIFNSTATTCFPSNELRTRCSVSILPSGVPLSRKVTQSTGCRSEPRHSRPQSQPEPNSQPAKLPVLSWRVTVGSL